MGKLQENIIEVEVVEFEIIQSSVKIIEDCPPKDGYELIELNKETEEYQTVNNKFTSSSRDSMKIITAWKLNNPFLKTMYELKLTEIKKIHEIGDDDGRIIERQLFHGTKKGNLHSICINNLDRRKCHTHKFGQGVSFSPQSRYSRYYTDCDRINIMLLCKVIIVKSTYGDADTKYPEDKCDTTRNYPETVFVKYDDDTYLPEYVIAYTEYSETDGDEVDKELQTVCDCLNIFKADA